MNQIHALFARLCPCPCPCPCVCAYIEIIPFKNPFDSRSQQSLKTHFLAHIQIIILIFVLHFYEEKNKMNIHGLKKKKNR